MIVQLSEEEYTALAYLARQVERGPDKAVQLEAFLKDIEKRNGIQRYLLWVQWQETDVVVQPDARFPEKWPPELRAFLERTDRQIAKSDVDAVLKARARKPVTVLVTSDPAAMTGWTEYAAHFKTS